MAENDNGRLNFGIGIDLDELKRGSDEAKGVFDGIASEARAKGADIDRAFGTDAARGASSLSSAVRQSLSEIGRSCSEHEAAIAALEGEYSRLGKEMSKAYETGRDGDLSELQERAAAVKAEISVRKELLSGLREQADALEQEAAKMEEARSRTEALGESHSSLRQRIRELQEQMAQLREQGIDETSEAYRELTAELGRLRDIQSDIQKQGSVLANDQAQFQGIISGLQGISGGYTAVSGAMSLFGTKNEDLNRIMAKAQSLMSITIGLQQVSQMLDKDSAFQLTTVAKVREWWNKLLDVGRGKTTANTAAVELNTAAQKGNAGAVRTAGAAQQMENTIAETGTAANIGLAGAFRMVGAAIKSVPVFGWIATAITAIVTVVTHFVSKAKEAREAAEEARKAQEEWNKSVAEMAAQPVAAVMKLRAQWNALGDDLESKRKFISDNAEEFRKLGLAINSVNDAEKVFTSKETLESYINAQLVRAKADKTYEDAVELIKKRNEAEVNLAKAEENLAKAQETPTVTRTITTMSPTVGGSVSQNITVANPDIKKYSDEVQQYRDEAKGLKTEIDETLDTFTNLDGEANKLMEAIGAGGSKIVEGSIEALQRDLRNQQDLVNKAVIGTEGYEEAVKKRDEIQSQLDAARGKTSGTSGAAKGQEQENRERESAIAKGGQVMERLTKQNEQTRIAQLDEGHDKSMERIDYAYKEEIAEAKKMAEEFREANEKAGVQTYTADTGQLDTSMRGGRGNDIGVGTITTEGLTEDQVKALYQRIEQAQKGYNRGVAALDEEEEEERRKHDEEEQKALESALNGIETYEQKREMIEREYQKKRDALYDEEGKLREGVTQGNLDNLAYQQDEDLFEAYLDYLNTLSDDMLAQEVEKMTAEVEGARQTLADAIAAGDEKAAADARKDLATKTKQCTAAEKQYKDAKKKSDAESKTNVQRNKEMAEELGTLGNAVGKCGDTFEEMGDAIGGAAGDALSSLGQITSQVGTFLNSVSQFVQVGIAGMSAASEAGAESIKTVEKASTILAIIGAVMQIAQTIAGLFKTNSQRRDEEIAALQERIDQLQWELDNAGAVRVSEAAGGALAVMDEVYEQCRKDFERLVDMSDRYWRSARGAQAITDKLLKSDAVHEKTVQGIIKTYTNLGYTVDKAIGEDRYRQVGEDLQNYAEQIALTYEQIQNEEAKRKKKDKDKIKEYEQTIAELEEEMVDALNSAVEDIIGGSYEDISKQLGDAFVEAFQAGEDAAEAWGDTVEDIVNDIVKQMLIQQWIEPEIAKIFDKYQEKWFTDGEYNGNDAVVASMNDFSDELNAVMDEFAVQWEAVSEAMGWAADSTREAASRGIAAASQESIDELNGRMTAIQGHTYSINDNVALLVSTNGQILQSVLNIEGNTDRLVAALEEAEDTADSIRRTIDDITLRGVKVK